MLAKQNSMMTEGKHAKLKSIGFIFDPEDAVKEEPLLPTTAVKDGEEGGAVAIKAEDLPKDEDEAWEKT